MNIILVGTGTAGHVYPAVALAEELIKRGHEINFITSEDGVENSLLADLKLPLHTLPSKPFFRVNFFDRLMAMFSFFGCVLLARRKLKLINPNLVLGFGGHVSAASIIAARSLNISTAIHEANALSGFGNRMVKKTVEKIYLGKLAEASFNNAKVTKIDHVKHVGFPIRTTLYKNNNKSTFDQKNIYLLVLGGSNGADFLNKNIALLVEKIRSRGITLEVTHQAGEGGVEVAQASYKDLDQKVNVVGYTENIGELYKKADFVISSAGAGTIAELCTWGIPCFLIPLAEASENHQEENAREFTRLIDLSDQLWLREKDWELEIVADRLQEILLNHNNYEKLSSSMLNIAMPNATVDMVDDMESVFN
ncbi:MAG: glycosyltransferase [Gammaproteobacteria bacterium]